MTSWHTNQEQASRYGCDVAITVRVRVRVVAAVSRGRK